jgi:hypothetical protein
LTGGIRKGAKGEPPVAYFYSATAYYSPAAAHTLQFLQSIQCRDFLIFFFSSADFLGYDTIPEEVYLSG